MSKMKNGEQPINPVLDLNKDLSGLRGLTKREYFAVMAMQGILSATKIRTSGYTAAANRAVLTADSLLKALEDE